MFLTDAEQNQLKELLSRFEGDSHVQDMKKYIQHGSVTTFTHCKNVTYVSFWMNRKFKLCSDEKALVTGAFLHDFYLYDWHVPEEYHRLHGFSHAKVASGNAVKFFGIGPKEQSIIQCHMWPLNITCIPQSREAVIVCLADKVCSLIEIFVHRK